MLWNRQMESLPREDMEALQLRRLKDTVRLMEPHSIERSQGKAVRIVDKRKE